MMLLNKFFWFFRALVYKFILNSVGNKSLVGKPLFLYKPKGITLGYSVRIFPLSRFECHDGGEIIINNDVSIGQSLHIISGYEPLIINQGTVISANVLITNIEHEYENIFSSISQQPLVLSKTDIGENCFIGYGAVIQAGTILGKHCIVGANSTVRGVFPDYSVIVGSPGRIVKRYDQAEKKWIKVNVAK